MYYLCKIANCFCTTLVLCNNELNKSCGLKPNTHCASLNASHVTKLPTLRIIVNGIIKSKSYPFFQFLLLKNALLF